jgi:hypothetical protein
MDGLSRRSIASSPGAQMQLDALVTAGVQKCDVFADVTSGQGGPRNFVLQPPLVKGPKACPGNQ